MDITPLTLVFIIGAVALAIAGAAITTVAALVAVAAGMEIFILGGRWAGWEKPEPTEYGDVG